MPGDEMHEFDTKDLKRLFGITASQVRALIRAGHIRPLKQSGRLRYSFQDLLVLRTAGALRAAKIPAQKINRTLRQIRASLPTSLPLSGLSIVALGDRIVVREGRALRESDSGQYALALEFVDQGGDILMIDRRRGAAAPLATAEAQFENALGLEDSDAAAAQAAYAACLAADPQHVEARLNLGRLLHIEGRLREAEQVYRSQKAPEPLLLYNLAVLLEDLEREPEALATYREALALDPELADAHFNLARLHERAGQAKDALRHLLAYRRLTGGQGS
ncbi:MAG: tetratricopeptide repeat protein [Steroidobacteraceae bacterium]